MTTDTTFEKTAADVNDYGRIWTDWLAEISDSINTSSWSVSPSGAGAPTLSGQQVLAGVTSVFISGGTVGTTYKLINTITTNGGRTASRALEITIVASRFL